MVHWTGGYGAAFRHFTRFEFFLLPNRIHARTSHHRKLLSNNSMIRMNISIGGIMNITTEIIRRVAYATGGAFILATILLAVFFAVDEPFGTLNDVFNGISGILCGVLASMFYSQHHAKSPLTGQIALALAIIGAIVVTVGTILVVFKVTGWVLAGWYSTAGYALIGIWLVMFCYSMLNDTTLPYRLTMFGVIIGLVMAVGLIAVIGILNKVDTMDGLPVSLNISYFGYLGDLLFPFWSIWLARALVAK